MASLVPEQLQRRFQRVGAHLSRALRHFRGDSRLLLGRVLARLVGPRKYCSRLPVEGISSVLICRINGRLGNTVLLTPLVKRIHELLPHASIDLVLAYPNACELLHNFPGLRRIIVFPHKGRIALAQVIERFAHGRVPLRPAAPRAFGFFAHATGLKVIERAWWLEFWEAFLELEPDAIPVEFLPPRATVLSDTRFPWMQFGSVRALTATIAATRMFISADTGPMHLASSTAVPTVALFCASDPALYGPLKPVDLAINIAESTPRLVAQRCQRLWRESFEGNSARP